MKKIIYLFLLVGFSDSIQAQTISKKVFASCCDTKAARCTGSASCRACTNCSRCAHCSNGGSCGVCSSTTTYVAPVKKAKRKYTTPKKTKTAQSFSAQQLLQVSTQKVKLRKGAGTNYEILETLSLGDRVIFKKKVGDWVWVKVEESGMVGYVYFKYLKN